MSDAPPEGLGLVVLLGGILLALALTAIGVVRLAKRGIAFRKRLEAYRTLPFAAELATMQASVARASLGQRAVPTIVARARGAFGEIDRARAIVSGSAGAVADVARAMFTR